MKSGLILLLILVFQQASSKETLKMEQIDSIVTSIRASKLAVERDTIVQNLLEIGLKNVTYLEQLADARELHRYSSLVNTQRSESGVTKVFTSSSTFYFFRNSLIKVEEFMVEDGNRKNMDWYFFEDKYLYGSEKAEKAESRARFLLSLSKTLLEKAVK